MSPMVLPLAILAAVVVLSPALRLLIAAVAGKQIGARALAKLPDEIHLEPRDASAWKHRATVGSLVDPLLSRGFVNAGIHAAPELPGLVVQLLANEKDGLYAAVYEHPKAGTWFDLVSRYQDGSSVTYSTALPTALKPRPGHPTVNLPGIEPLALLDRILAQRPRRPLKPVSPDQATSVFEQGYADSIDYRKQVGISTGEVMGTAARKIA